MALSLLLGLGVAPALAASVHVAVAANFTATAERLAEAFELETGNQLVLGFAATGALYAQISQGAPFEVLLGADGVHAKRAVDEGFGVPGSVFTYAIGALVLFSASEDASRGAGVLDGPFNKLAIANPETAPYGLAAVQTLKSLGRYERLLPKLVIGESISQALQFVSTGNAEFGFVAASQVLGEGSQWVVPPELYQPIVQDAVLLRIGESNPAAYEFLSFLRSKAGVAIIASDGYAVPDQP